jgi:hypothetical protein
MPLAKALEFFARQTGLQLVYVSQAVQGAVSKGAPAGLTPRETLSRLLEGTGVTFEFLNERTVRIFPIASSGHPGTKLNADMAATRRPDGHVDRSVNGADNDSHNNAEADSKGDKVMNGRNFLARIAGLFAVCSAVHPVDACAQEVAEQGGGKLEEIVVTARKREESILRVP